MPSKHIGMTTLPDISDTPRHHPDCCLSLSNKLIQKIGRHQQSGSTLISIGSGSGLLEALIQQQYPQTRVIGIEVNDTVNKYLSSENALTVKGTWDIYDKSSEDSIWLFIYPRRSRLISSYLELPRVARKIIWLGPWKDWEEEFRSAFVAHGKFGIKEIEDAGLSSYETMFVMTEKDGDASREASAPLSTSQIDEI